jgi:hypothetical protein
MTINKSQTSAGKRTIDLGKIPVTDQIDLIRVFRVGTGDEKAITVRNLILSIIDEPIIDDSTLAEIIAELEFQIDNMDLQAVTNKGNSTTNTIIHADANLPEESATLGQILNITGDLGDLNTADKDNLVIGINQANSWKVIEW